MLDPFRDENERRGDQSPNTTIDVDGVKLHPQSTPAPLSDLTADLFYPQSVSDPLAPDRRVIAYILLGTLAGMLLASAIMLSLTLWLRISEGPHFVLDWMGLGLGPVAALAGSSVTFYMERSSRRK